ncbi:hypothetical protein R1flu_018983 [Riccia fluitans]|uniref:Uncharacterized protein n=1 Tax=Riccia fluitans TaxID=41844 RepID=A0ABD1ZIV3_9MARC
MVNAHDPATGLDGQSVLQYRDLNTYLDALRPGVAEHSVLGCFTIPLLPTTVHSPPRQPKFLRFGLPCIPKHASSGPYLALVRLSMRRALRSYDGVAQSGAPDGIAKGLGVNSSRRRLVARIGVLDLSDR